MDTSRPAASSNTVIDALVLAYSHSELRELLAVSTLRDMLQVQYSEPPAHGKLDLEPVWQLLAQLPGFNASAAEAAMCRFKLWEPLLGMPVALPQALAHLSDTDAVLRAASCQVPSTAIHLLFRDSNYGQLMAGSSPDALAGLAGRERHSTIPPEARARSSTIPPGERRHPTTLPPPPESRRHRTTLPPPPELGRRRTTSHPRASSKGSPAASPGTTSPGRRTAIQIVAAVVAVLSFGSVGMSLYRDCRPTGQWDEIKPDFAGRLPVTRTARIGDQVRGELTNEGWLALPEEQRNGALEQALRTLEPKGVTVLFLQDRHGQVRATAQLYADGTKIRFIYR